MNNRKHISEELLTLSPTLAALTVVNVFSVPDDYFNSLSGSVLSAISADNNIIFSSIEKQSLSVPEGYFDGLADAILNKIKGQSGNTAPGEMGHLSPTIFAIGNKNIFTVPENYFENNTSEIISNIPKPAMLVEMKKRSFIFKYAAAAVVSGIIGLTVLSLFNNKNDTSNPLLPQAAMAQAGEIIKNNSFEKELNNVSDKDIQQYLEQHGQDVNAALVASVTDDNNLPNPEDYITDDKTLDDYLNKINLNN
ncbi:MAG: hypothetical protein ABJA37_11410 [Ferruginibacter sp.]